MNKKEKMLVSELIDEVYQAGHYNGELKMVEHMRDCSIKSLEAGYTGILHATIIKVHVKEVKRFSKLKAEFIDKSKRIIEEIKL